MSQRLLLHERARDGGALERTWLEVDGDALMLAIEVRDASAPTSGEQGRQAPSVASPDWRSVVPIAFLDGIMRRYGKPLDDGVVLDRPSIAIGERTLGMLRYRPRYDVIAKDYFVYGMGEGTPRVELATSVSAALAYLIGRTEKMGAEHS
jgi:hypothetical protein